MAPRFETSGKKHVLGLWQGATGNTAVLKDLLEYLVARGLRTERRYLFVSAALSISEQA